MALRHLIDAPFSPRRGDLVVYFRDAQDPSAEAAEEIRRAEASVVWGPGLLGERELRRIDEFLDRYMKQWFFRDGEDISRDQDLSLGMYLSGQLATSQKPTLLLTLGEICRRVFAQASPGAQILSDILDGQTAYPNTIPDPAISPRRSLIRYLAEQHSLAYSDLTVDRPIPLIEGPEHGNHIFNHGLQLVRSYLGGFRPAYLLGRLKSPFRRKKGKVYVFLNHGIHLIALALKQHDRVSVFCDLDSDTGAVPLRYDHFFTWPSRSLRGAARRLRHRVRELEGHASQTFVFDGLDYKPFLLVGIDAYLRHRLLADLIKIAQGHALVERLGECVFIINGDVPAMYAAVGYAPSVGGKVIYLDHGLNMFAQGLRDGILNQRKVTYLIHGMDHRKAYGASMPDELKPRQIQLSNPATTVMNRAKGRRASPSKKRVLFANYTANYANYCARLYKYDRYMRDLCRASQMLIRRGISVSYRPHHGENREYIAYMFEAFGLESKVRLDTVPNFSEALLQHDVFAANTTSCVYQALYAGWPTIFFEPDFRAEDFIGLPAATDIGPPVADGPEELVHMIELALQPDSKIARFPEKFNTEFSARFIGKDADRAGKAVAEFILSEIRNSSKNQDKLAA